MVSHCIWSNGNCLRLDSFVNVTISICGIYLNNPNILSADDYKIIL